MEEKKKQKMFKFQKITLQLFAIILFITILVLSLITLFSTVKANNLAFLRHRIYIMDTNSQPDIALKGDLVIAKKLKYGQIKQGDKIVYSDTRFYYCDEVVQTRKNNTIIKLIIAENEGIRYQFSENEVEGKIIYTIPKLGNIISFLRTPVGMIIFSITTICIFILLRIVFIKKDKENSDEDDKILEIEQEIDVANKEIKEDVKHEINQNENAKETIKNK